jgi:phosphoglycerate dehydrogenase-like enzyme
MCDNGEVRIHVSEELAGEERRVFDGLKVSFGAEIPGDVEVLVNGVVSEDDVSEFGELRAVIVPWAGVPKSTREAGLAKGFAVYNLHHNSGATSQTAVALMLAVTRDIVGMDAEFRAGSWRARYEGADTMTLEGKTAVILGFGEIGRKVGAACEAMGMRVVGVSRSNGVGLDDALRQADVLHICLPLTNETKGLLTREKLALLPDGAVVVNVGRGAIVDEQALFDEVKNRRFFGAGLDVWWKYPADEGPYEVPPGDCDWASLRNVVMTPHRGGTGVGEMARWRAVREILDAMISGDLGVNRVDLEAGY